jgi:hypothetical protein
VTLAVGTSTTGARRKIVDLCDASDLHGTVDLQAPRRIWQSSEAHAYLRRSSNEPTTILLRKQKFRLIGIGPFTYRAIAGAPGRRAINTKNWYRTETDLWAEFGKETPFSKNFSSKHSIKMPAVRSTPSFRRRAVLRLEEEAFGNT